MRVEPWHDDVAALHKPNAPRADVAHDISENPRHIRPGGVHQHARTGLGAACQRQPPHAVRMPCPDAARARTDIRPQRRGITCGQHDETGIIHPAIGILEPARILGTQRLTRGIVAQIDHPRRRQNPASAQMVIDEQPKPDQPPRPQPGMVRQHEAQRTDDVRRRPQQYLALGQDSRTRRKA